MRRLLTLLQSSLELAQLLDSQSQVLQGKVSVVLGHF